MPKWSRTRLGPPKDLSKTTSYKLTMPLELVREPRVLPYQLRILKVLSTFPGHEVDGPPIRERCVNNENAAPVGLHDTRARSIFYKQLKNLITEGYIEKAPEHTVGRSKPTNIYKLTQKGLRAIEGLGVTASEAGLQLTPTSKGSP